MCKCVNAEAAREVATAQSRVADSERLAYDSEQVVLHRDPQGSSEHFKEAAHLARQKADAERRAGISQAAQQQTEQSLRMAQLELARLKVWSFAYLSKTCNMMCSSNHEDVQY